MADKEKERKKKPNTIAEPDIESAQHAACLDCSASERCALSDGGGKIETSRTVYSCQHELRAVVC